MKHFVITRLGLCVYSADWFDRMIGLFEAVTLASLARQSDPNFVWLIVVDAGMPAQARRKIEELVSPRANCRLVAIDVTRVTRVRQGCFDWVWDHCQDFILESGLIEDPCDYIITSVIDADDAWHRDVMSTVNSFVGRRLPQLCIGEEARGTWLRHTCGVAATFPRGYKWFVASHALEPVEFPFMSMAVFVAARFSSGISACSSRHRGWPSYCDVLAFEAAEIEPDRPMWVYSRHDRSTQPWDAGPLVPMESHESARLHDEFGIDQDKVEQWRQQYPALATQSRSATHSGCDVSAQYDRIFRIAALNRKIEALKHREGPRCGAGARKPLHEVLARTQEQRGALIDELRANG